MSYKLSNVLSGHESDVRAVRSPTDNLVLSASRDTTAISWTRENPTQSFNSTSVYRASSKYVNSIEYLPPTSSHPQGLVIIGGQDAIINIFDTHSNSSEPIYALLGHTDNICAMHTSGENTIISGSWDRSARVWQQFQLVFELKGHEQAVWAVAAINTSSFLTGSADRTIKLWEEHKNVKTYTGHNDAVRGLALIPGVGFASCSNDGEIRIWTLGGDTLHALSGHTSFVYSLSILPSGDLVSGGEDRSVRIWKNGVCVQTIVHPAISVWAVSTMPNGDIVSGCSDGVVRIFSTSEERWASAEDLKNYDEVIANQSLPSQQIGDVKKSDLPSLDALMEPGKKDGQVKMVQNNGVVEAHQWNSGTFQWQKVGEVVDAVGSGRRQLYEGKEYDYVFDVDIQDGVPPLKLPYNANENPYSAAQRFLEKHDLPLSYIDQVVAFIEKNAQNVTIGSSREEYMDPFTGASRYRSAAGAHSTFQAGDAGFRDPFTGGSRYQPTSTAGQSPQGTPGDPFTGGSRYQPSGSGTPQSASILPVTQPLPFKQANVSAMKSKLHTLNNELSDPSLHMTSEELKSMDETFTVLTVAVTTKAKTADLSSSHLEAISRIAGRWPPSHCFPLIDLARLVCAFTPTLCSDYNLMTRLIQSIARAAELHLPWGAPLDKHRDVNTLLVLRVAANMLHGGISSGSLGWASTILSPMRNANYTSMNKNQRMALATLLFNISSVTYYTGTLQRELEVLVHSMIIKVLREEREDSETFYRGLVALGNMACVHARVKVKLDEQTIEAMKEVSRDAPKMFAEKRVTDVAGELGVLAEGL